ncbi:MAG: transposase [Anaerolineae bacterium]|nr:transposase [Anaerolineae bacterium]
MTKTTPLEFGHYYHIYNRGNNRENLFRKPDNYYYFLKLYTKHINPIADTFAYCLLPNHFHLLVKIKVVEAIKHDQRKPLKEPSQYFSNFFNAYARAFNNAFQRTGALFERPFGRIPVTSDTYFTQLVIYIHRNPQKHRLIADFREWPYSSYHTLFSDKPTYMQRDAVLEWFGGFQEIEPLHQSGVNEALLEPLILEDFD